MALVSVVMPAFNAASTIAAAVASVLDQTFADFELIVVDDGSTDDTQRVLESATDPRIKVLHLSHNQGIAAALNAGFEQTTGQLLARMDADDLCHPQRLEKQVAQFHADPALCVAGTLVETMGPGSIQWKMPLSDEGIRARLLFGTGLFHPTVMMRRDLMEQGLLRYDPTWVPVEDHELWTRLGKDPLCRFANLPQPLVTYRARPRDSDYGGRQRAMSACVSERLAAHLGLISTTEEIALWRVLAGSADTDPVEAGDLINFSRHLGAQDILGYGVDAIAMGAEIRHRWYTMGISAQLGLRYPALAVARYVGDPLIRAYLSGRVGALARRYRPLRYGYNYWQNRHRSFN